MTTEQVLVWHVGVQNSSGRAEHIVVTDEYPAGRYTMDQAQALIWAQETAVMANSNPESGATDWLPVAWQAELPRTD